MSDVTRRVTVAQQRKWLQQSLMAAVTPEDMQDVILMLITKARGGSIAAAKELLDRTLGKPTQEIIVEQQEEKSPDDVRGRLAALLIAHPELKSVLELAGNERKLETMTPAERMQAEVESNTTISQNPDKYESDE
ncbi:MAG: hypothetical protein Unbinned4614contig1000_20 [Prokaryotic dsDNA virus sp.]|nr:MAG: hypothetical protein Unbinned4614contig1000_20 [Prokaryotic dsDNA virus sp.]|tara:strand:+ start:866 stop:1270 length:405 start_codon:yes stop_codon:yes gene_type:complete